MAIRLCKVCSDWHSLDEPWPHNCMPERIWTRSELSGPMIIKDCMEPVKSMLDGKMYDSKRRLRQTYREAGVTEVGGEKIKPFKKPRPSKTQIRESVDRAFSRAGLGA